MAGEQRLSVVVPTRDRPSFLAACLDRLVASLREDDELIVVDSASRDPMVREVAEAAGARYLRCTVPGASRARNLGWRAARHELIAFVDDDVRVEAGWAAAARTLEGSPHTAFLTGRIGLSADQESSERPVALLDEDQARDLDADSRGSIGHSANLTVRREALERVGGFDELLGAGATFQAAEDYDLFDRLFSAGHVGRYDPDAAATHEQWRTRSDLLRLDWGYGFGTGARIAKLLRTDRRRAGRIAVDFLWSYTLRVAVKDLLRGYEFGSLTRLLRAAGTLVGFVRALPYRLRDGHLERRFA